MKRLTMPSVKTLKSFGLYPQQARKARKAPLATVGPLTAERLLALVGQDLQHYGVEWIRFDSRSRRSRFLAYLNTGDAYRCTLLSWERSNRVFVGSWGDVVESMEKRGWRTE